jgi:hypothetical protein
VAEAAVLSIIIPLIALGLYVLQQSQERWAQRRRTDG